MNVQGLVPQIKKLIFLHHSYGYQDIQWTVCQKEFEYYQRIGCRHQPACLTPSDKKDSDIPYYRGYSEAIDTKLYFKGFSLSEIRKYAASYSGQSACSKCAYTDFRPVVKCRWP